MPVQSELHKIVRIPTCALGTVKTLIPSNDKATAEQMPVHFRSVHHLRGVAAISICLLHSGFPFLRSQLNAGVVLFFIISGLVIFISTSRGADFSLKNFCVRRIIRILPLWWIALLWFSCFTIYFGLGWSINWLKVAQSATLAPMQNVNGHMRPYLNVGWTLTYEAFFYILFGAMVYIRIWWLCSAIIVFLVCAGWLLEPTSFLGHVFTNPIMLSFVIGCHIGQAYLSGYRFNPILLPIGFILLLIGPSDSVIISCALIIAGAISVDRYWPDISLFDFLGAASYSIYLFHFSVTYLLERVSPHPSWVVIFILAISLGCVMHLILEKPLITFLRRNIIVSPLRNG